MFGNSQMHFPYAYHCFSLYVIREHKRIHCTDMFSYSKTVLKLQIRIHSLIVRQFLNNIVQFISFNVIFCAYHFKSEGDANGLRLLSTCFLCVSVCVCVCVCVFFSINSTAILLVWKKISNDSWNS